MANDLRFLIGERPVICSDSVKLWLYTDSSSAQAARRGVGRLKHLDIRHLWVRRGYLQVFCVPTAYSAADFNAKKLSMEGCAELCQCRLFAIASMVWEFDWNAVAVIVLVNICANPVYATTMGFRVASVSLRELSQNEEGLRRAMSCEE